MAVYGEELPSSVTRLRRDTGMDTETERQPTVTSSTEERGGAFLASHPQSNSAPSSLPPGREWNRVGDFINGRYDSSQGLW